MCPTSPRPQRPAPPDATGSLRYSPWVPPGEARGMGGETGGAVEGAAAGLRVGHHHVTAVPVEGADGGAVGGRVPLAGDAAEEEPHPRPRLRRRAEEASARG